MNVSVVLVAANDVGAGPNIRAVRARRAYPVSFFRGVFQTSWINMRT